MAGQVLIKPAGSSGDAASAPPNNRSVFEKLLKTGVQSSGTFTRSVSSERAVHTY